MDADSRRLASYHSVPPRKHHCVRSAEAITRKPGYQLQIVNEELEKVIQRNEKEKFQESDIEYLDGADAFRKDTGCQRVCVKEI